MSTAKHNHQQQVEYGSRAGRLIFDCRKAAFLPDDRTLLVADLHFEKASYLQVIGGAPLPTYDTDDTLGRLKALITHYNPNHVVALGDSFHDIHAGARMDKDHHAALNTIVHSVPHFTWILGNHDPDIPASLGGDRQDHVECGDFLLTHHPEVPKTESGVNVCGHLHPKVRIATRRRNVFHPCFAVSEERIILPSFGTFTGGLNVDHEAIDAALPGEKIYIATLADHLVLIPRLN